MIGIGGISMSGIAEILKSWGFTVTGSDANDSPIIKKLQKSLKNFGRKLQRRLKNKEKREKEDQLINTLIVD